MPGLAVVLFAELGGVAAKKLWHASEQLERMAIDTSAIRAELEELPEPEEA